MAETDQSARQPAQPQVLLVDDPAGMLEQARRALRAIASEQAQAELETTAPMSPADEEALREMFEAHLVYFGFAGAFRRDTDTTGGLPGEYIDDEVAIRWEITRAAWRAAAATRARLDAHQERSAQNTVLAEHDVIDGSDSRFLLALREATGWSDADIARFSVSSASMRADWDLFPRWIYGQLSRPSRLSQEARAADDTASETLRRTAAGNIANITAGNHSAAQQRNPDTTRILFMNQPITFDTQLELTNGTDLDAPHAAHIVWSEKDLHTLAGAIASARLLAKATEQSPAIVETRIELPAVITFYADEEGTEEWDAEDGELVFNPSSEWLSVTPGLPGQASVRLEVWERHVDGDVSAIADLKDLGISDVVEGFVLKAYERLGLPRSLWPQKDEHVLAAVQRNPGFIAQLSDAEQTETLVREVVRQAPTAVQLFVQDEARLLAALQENLACVQALHMSHIDGVFDHPLTMAGVIEYIQDNWSAIEALDWSGLDETDGGKDLLENLRQKVRVQAAQRPRQR